MSAKDLSTAWARIRPGHASALITTVVAMPRTCDVNGCKERGDHLEGWSVPQFTRLVVLWFCDEHYAQSLAYSDDQSGYVQ